jgi:hypothetical protein
MFTSDDFEDVKALIEAHTYKYNGLILGKANGRIKAIGAK